MLKMQWKRLLLSALCQSPQRPFRRRVSRSARRGPSQRSIGHRRTSRGNCVIAVIDNGNCTRDVTRNCNGSRTALPCATSKREIASAGPGRGDSARVRRRRYAGIVCDSGHGLIKRSTGKAGARQGICVSRRIVVWIRASNRRSQDSSPGAGQSAITHRRPGSCSSAAIPRSHDSYSSWGIACDCDCGRSTDATTTSKCEIASAGSGGGDPAGVGRRQHASPASAGACAAGGQFGPESSRVGVRAPK